MNFYFLVEGKKTEKLVYTSWMSHVFPQVTRVYTLEDIEDNHYYIIVGNGYPSYIDRIKNSLKDIQNRNNIDYFIICIDAEEDSYKDKWQEIQQLVEAYRQEIRLRTLNYQVIVQDPCIETWFLGNKTMIKRNPQSSLLREWKAFFDVSIADPEEMPCPPNYEESRAQFHLDYLKAMLNERNQTYSKALPGTVQKKHYLMKLVERYTQTGQISSFGKLVEFWRGLGGAI